MTPGKNDLATTHPELAAQAVGWDPTTVMAGTGQILDWRCDQGHVYPSNGANRLHGQGCPSCATYGYDPRKEGWLYLMRHFAHGLLKIGITNEPDVRLASHRTRGWELVDLRGPMDGSLTRSWEQSILLWLKDRCVEFADRDTVGGFSGYTESWVELSHSVSSIRELMEAVEDGEMELRQST